MVTRKKRSILWKVDAEELKKTIASSGSISAVLDHFGIKNIGGNYQTLRARLEHEGIDYSHIPRGIGSNKGRKFNVKKIPLDKVMTEHSTYSRFGLKRRLIGEGVLVDQCSMCGLPPEWHGNKLVMILDHINGVRDDNRRENLRLVCPNCASTLPTHCGRNLPKRTSNCTVCGKVIISGGRTCSKECEVKAGKKPREYRRKVKRPSLDVLLKELEEMGYTRMGAKYGVIGNTIKKWIIAYGAIPPHMKLGPSKQFLEQTRFTALL